ncbi:hypothetical protein H4R18_003064 [Coemansia javaensis]|uniref:Uncharacterized protein n=1 Tax=Coemansia javaensis TaxID=2761396 RepID=A0A9W8LI99_9FUNG|nr:hypothetical protein H4R18_003064 [Coemansia javaensis]
MSSHIPLPKERHSKSKLFVTVSSLGSKRREHARAIETHPFNYRLAVVVPRGAADAQAIVARHVGSYFKIRLRLSDLIDPGFVGSYVKQNTLLALSANRLIDADDVFAVDGSGKLILSLCKDTYETLGLAGRQAAFPLQRGARFTVEIDLLAGCMDPAKKHFQRIRARLDAVLAEPVEFVVGYYDRRTGAALNLDLPGAVACEPRVVTGAVAGAAVPGISDAFLGARRQSDEWVGQAQALFEWIGLAAAGSQAVVPALAEAMGAETCMYSAPEPSGAGDLAVCSVRGLLSPMAISSVVADLLEAGADFYVCVWGHEDAPVSWGAAEHGFLVSGEHVCAQAYLPQRGRCLTFQACGPWDAFS